MFFLFPLWLKQPLLVTSQRLNCSLRSYERYQWELWLNRKKTWKSPWNISPAGGLARSKREKKHRFHAPRGARLYPEGAAIGQSYLLNEIESLD
jgi:hypothetical protein